MMNQSLSGAPSIEPFVKPSIPPEFGLRPTMGANGEVRLGPYVGPYIGPI